VTYPLTAGKKPAVRAYDRIGAPYSAQLAMKFADATAAGFVAGRRNRLAIGDIDSTDDRLVAEFQKKYGVTPLQVLTPSGGSHLYYRHNGETRRIRLFDDVDLLGAGPVVAAGSRTPAGRYEIVRGSLEDLERLPRLAATTALPQQARERIPVGERNNELFKYCTGIVRHCDTLDQLLDAARTWAEGRLAEPLPEIEIVKTCDSVWTYRGGRKRIVNHIIESPIYAKLIDNMEALALFAYLGAENGVDAEFMVANGIAEARGWPRRSVQNARKALLELQVIKCVRPPRKGAPALYRWRLPHE
jgi:Bifunctional DNA primase/polymerase, N-terminal